MLADNALRRPSGVQPYAIAVLNDWFHSMGLAALKPLAEALLLPPVPFLALMLLGAWWLRRKPLRGWLALLLGAALTWASFTQSAAQGLSSLLLRPPPALLDPRSLLAAPQPAGGTVIVVLGGGRVQVAEYPYTAPSPITLERLRYGIWLSRQTGFPLLFSGGMSPGSKGTLSEAEVAERVAREEFRHPLRWTEDRSRDTRENADRTVELLRAERPGRVVLVTHDMHLARALRNFERARSAAGLGFALVPAGCGYVVRAEGLSWRDHLPSTGGLMRMRYVWHEWLGLLAGA